MSGSTVYLVFILLCFALIACTAKKRTSIYRILFDGVPEEVGDIVLQDSLAISDSTEFENAQNSKIINTEFYFHAVYQQKECDACHEISQGNVLLEQPPELCYGCHDDYREENTVLHGPVGAGMCLTCHNPHFAKNEKLLLKKKDELCLDCHESGLVYQNEVHDGVERSDCLECHNPHASQEMYMLN